MTTAANAQDLFTRLEREVRAPKERLLVDAFLPPPEAIPSSLQQPAVPRPAPEAAREQDAEADLTANMAGARRRAEEAPEAAPAPRRRPAKRATAPEKSLEEEIAEFMSRGSGALAPDADPET